jgi:hypothetical protein
MTHRLTGSEVDPHVRLLLARRVRHHEKGVARPERREMTIPASEDDAMHRGSESPWTVLGEG